ncbi:FKBP-type peptidyl-prolyl cis-trans isomerase [Parasediminibacterium sp. JCM 36343]|uniref:FKBP-type peptidyl-prolyl cis-trans isomerase n=1 Tax=Parasediminibacterium sp. JCM 36343 TaxID=3374279 RepID=UPI0039783248
MKKSALFLATTIVALNMNAQVKKTVVTKATTTTSAKPTVKAAPAAGPAIVFKNNADSASYALGVRIAQNIKTQGFEGISQSLLQRAISDVLQTKKLALPDSLLDGCLGAYQKKAMTAKSSVAKKEGEAFLAANAKRKGVVVLADGLQYEVMKTGTDTTHPTLTDKVKCHYHGTLLNGTVFDSSVDRGEPITFPLNGVIKGWQEAVQLMTVGSKWKLFIPSDLAYGDQQAGPSIAPGSTLIFEVELLGIEK